MEFEVRFQGAVGQEAGEQMRHHFVVDLGGAFGAAGPGEAGFDQAGPGSLRKNEDGGTHRRNCRMV